MDVRKYKEYVVFSIIACPLLLLDWGIFDLYESFDLHLLIVPVFRDLVSTYARTVCVCVVCMCVWINLYVHYLCLTYDYFCQVTSYDK